MYCLKGYRERCHLSTATLATGKLTKLYLFFVFLLLNSCTSSKKKILKKFRVFVHFFTFFEIRLRVFKEMNHSGFECFGIKEGRKEGNKEMRSEKSFFHFSTTKKKKKKKKTR